MAHLGAPLPWPALLIASSIFVVSLARGSEDDTVAVSGQGTAPSPRDDTERWTLVGRMVPPFLRIERELADAYPRTNAQLGGLALGAIAPSRLWLEGGASLLHGLEGLSWETTAVGGYAFGYARARETWNFSVPVYAGYRFAERPSMWPTDGRNVTRPTHYVVGGMRLVGTRFFSSGLLELGVDISIALPFAEDEPSNSFWRDPTSTWINGAFVVGI
jgi:hypothetical protein